jgi:hypothetical protein
VYGIREVPENEKNLQVNGTLEILFYGNDDNLLTKNKQTFCDGNESGAFFVASKECCLVERLQVKV